MVFVAISSLAIVFLYYLPVHMLFMTFTAPQMPGVGSNQLLAAAAANVPPHAAGLIQNGHNLHHPAAFMQGVVHSNLLCLSLIRSVCFLCCSCVVPLLSSELGLLSLAHVTVVCPCHKLTRERTLFYCDLENGGGHCCTPHRLVFHLTL